MTQELRRLAEAATQGEWAFGSFHRLLVVPMRDGVPEKHDYIADLGETEIPWNKTIDSAERYHNAAFIAAANPAAILSLLDRLEMAEAQAKADFLELQSLGRLAKQATEAMRRYRSNMAPHDAAVVQLINQAIKRLHI